MAARSTTKRALSAVGLPDSLSVITKGASSNALAVEQHIEGPTCQAVEITFVNQTLRAKGVITSARDGCIAKGAPHPGIFIQASVIITVGCCDEIHKANTPAVRSEGVTCLPSPPAVSAVVISCGNKKALAQAAIIANATSSHVPTEP